MANIKDHERKLVKDRASLAKKRSKSPKCEVTVERRNIIPIAAHRGSLQGNVPVHLRGCAYALSEITRSIARQDPTLVRYGDKRNLDVCAALDAVIDRLCTSECVVAITDNDVSAPAFFVLALQQFFRPANGFWVINNTSNLNVGDVEATLHALREAEEDAAENPDSPVVMMMSQREFRKTQMRHLRQVRRSVSEVAKLKRNTG
ncbi:hypothetical protein AB8B21_27870 [Tardiphaga sp. 866_E4_N2_1]|uniref:hypothetical protein n=1 Tax=unclassified Tardiphaga TaxID=2631404 RepID=UPI003F28A5D2